MINYDERVFPPASDATATAATATSTVSNSTAATRSTTSAAGTSVKPLTKRRLKKIVRALAKKYQENREEDGGEGEG